MCCSIAIDSHGQTPHVHRSQIIHFHLLCIEFGLVSYWFWLASVITESRVARFRIGFWLAFVGRAVIWIAAISDFLILVNGNLLSGFGFRIQLSVIL